MTVNKLQKEHPNTLGHLENAFSFLLTLLQDVGLHPLRVASSLGTPVTSNVVQQLGSKFFTKTIVFTFHRCQTSYNLTSCPHGG